MTKSLTLVMFLTFGKVVLCKLIVNDWVKDLWVVWLMCISHIFKLLGLFCVVQVTVKGVVLLNVSLSREVVPSFARILLHTSLGKKHLVRPLLRTEITQVVNRRSWYDAAKLTTEVLTLYKVYVCTLSYMFIRTGTAFFFCKFQTADIINCM